MPPTLVSAYILQLVELMKEDKRVKVSIEYSPLKHLNPTTVPTADNLTWKEF